MNIRPARVGDAALLWPFLAVAAHEPSAEAAMAEPVVARHLAGWPRSGDFGVIAEIDGAAVGAAWARQFRPDEGPYVFINDMTPEIAIGVLPDRRGQGIGAALLAALVEMARGRCRGLCLNVRDSNPAVRLYEKAGFVRVAGSEVTNRVGGLSFGMALRLPCALWRPMRAEDLPAAMAVADVVHPDLPESPDVFAERLKLFPAGCFVAEDGRGRLLGYALTHPARLGYPPSLDTVMGALPANADCLHIHDVALLPEARGLGLGDALTGRLKELARETGLRRLALVAVYDAARFWRRHGFQDHANPALAAKMAAYGEGAAYMVA